jgi:hypothetical protein
VYKTHHYNCSWHIVKNKVNEKLFQNKKFTKNQKAVSMPGIVAHSCNPSISRAESWRISVWPLGPKVSETTS